MTKNTTSTARLSSLETRFDGLESRLDRVLAALEGKPTKVAKAPKASKAKKAKADGVPFKALQLRLREHKVAGAIVAGVSVREAIAQGLMTATGDLPGVAKATGKAAPKVEPKVTPKAEPKKARQVAKVEADAPAKERAASGPRDAMGRITPKAQWDLRESLAMTGKFDRHEIDAIVASGV